MGLKLVLTVVEHHPDPDFHKHAQLPKNPVLQLVRNLVDGLDYFDVRVALLILCLDEVWNPGGLMLHQESPDVRLQKLRLPEVEAAELYDG